MQVSTQPSASSLFAPYKDQFLIVPIFFKQQIESIIAAKAPEYAFGFFYGEQRENYRIIKKIWPVARVEGSARNVVISSEDFENARQLEGNKLRLLGCFYTSANGGVSKALLSSSQLDSFSFVKLRETENQTCIWSSSLRTGQAGKMINERGIL
ncbi:MAG: hypothetical protein IPL46_07925 [Saprospiraceae bacterium]|nr:hypothetical protein [Saprospiraceae bacterium]